jgi:ribosomal protein S18 acetylase RimI-like enzyme
MKAKDLKILRKRLARANRTDRDVLRDNVPDDRLVIPRMMMTMVPPDPAGPDPPPPSTGAHQSLMKLTYAASGDLPDGRFDECLGLFRTNMAALYEGSSWGLDMAEKEAELRHGRARFLFLWDNDADLGATTTTSSRLAAFVHFRFEHDDEEGPTCAVLYVYEIQIDEAYRRHGLGRWLMGIAEAIAAGEGMAKVLLTVFKANRGAMQFYEKLGYGVDETSPDDEDYLILSRTISPDRKA